MDGALSSGDRSLCAAGPASTFCFELTRDLFKGSLDTSDPFMDFLGWMRILGASVYLLEDLADFPELEYERNCFRQRVSHTTARTSASRITFFSAGTAGSDWRDSRQIPDDAILGYAVLFRHEILGETVVNIHEAVVRWLATSNGPALVNRENYYVHCVRDHATQIGAAPPRHLTIRGAFFAQANGYTSVCAHAAIRATLNSTPHFTGPKVTNKDVDEALEIDFSQARYRFGRLHGEERPTDALDGLPAPDMGRAVMKITAESLRLLSYETFYEAGADFDRFLYPYMESGYPVILGINGWDFHRRDYIKHVLTIIGHTLNVDRWSPEASACYGQPHFDGFHPACDWTDHYIAHDDRQGMYATIQSDLLRPLMLPARNPWIHPILALALVPNETSVPAHSFETLGSVILLDFLEQRRKLGRPATTWETEIGHLLRESRSRGSSMPIIVTRVTITDRDTYVTSLLSALASETFTEKQRAALNSLPSCLAICELTLPSLYSTEIKKLGDVVFDTSPPVRIDYQGQAGEAIATTARLFWFDGLWQSQESGGEDWPVSGAVDMRRS